jgi:3-deoxy-D-manno-octulosonate 8-phosphate phosphatase (KDO 8-P phosphatase)
MAFPGASMAALIRRMQHRYGWWCQRDLLPRIDLVVLDVDGVLTDGGLWHGPEGELIKRFDVRDGMGIKLLLQAGLEVVFLSGGRGGATNVRAQQLGVRHCLVGVKDKPQALRGLYDQLGRAAETTLFVGDDLNDLAVLGQVGLLVATADATPPLRRQADAVLLRRGGAGAVRELAERLLRARGLWQELCCQGWRDTND